MSEVRGGGGSEVFLVQRVKSRRTARKEGLNKDVKSIDHYFEMDYPECDQDVRRTCPTCGGAGA